ncbi:MAG: 7-beta-(4-carbaxybutanamido)cephalosporanic acid acylase [Bacteroidetes bacterium GWC2_40_22]|nr:MAG: 7-beta-(4-carbaxybutanamido)cephalosporanic acid acylase [Bacteroidetes bacterium GWC2_40_22]
MKKTLTLLPAIILLLTGSCNSGKSQQDTEILWDNYGVPHIYAPDAAQMYYAYGKAQMHSHSNLILKLYAQARGKSAAFFGRDYLESDKLINLFRINEKAEDCYKNMGGEYKSYLDAFVRGINDYASENPGSIPDDYKKILPVTASDVMAHIIRVLCIEFLAMDDIYAVKRLTEAGSNAMAISPVRSESGNAILVSNPHLPWSDFFTWYEAHLVSDDFIVYGVSLAGMPSVIIAFNEYLGWTHTVNTIDASDRYELELKDGGYILDDNIVQFNKKTASIEILEKDGSVTTEEFDFRYSEHGPVVAEKGDKAWAVRIAGLENGRIFEQYHKMGKAKNLAEFEEAMKMLQNPMFNVVYADRDGNILYLFNGNVPVRKSGDFSFWNGTINGTSSDMIWKEYHTYESLPKVINPASGFLQNCNDPPWNCTWPAVLKPGDFPPYMAPVRMELRPQRAVNLIKDHEKLSFGDMVDIKLNTGMESADRFLDDLLKAAEGSSDKRVTDAAAVLKKWDRKTDPESRGAVLFAEWWDNRGNLAEIPWSNEEPVSTPRGIKDPGKAVEILAQAAENVIKKYGSADVSIGEIFRLRINGYDFPSNGGPEYYGVLRAMYYAGDSDGRMRTVAGDTYYAVTEFGRKVRSLVLLSYGNSSQPGSKHYGDQLQMMSEKKMRPALFYREDVEKSIEKREVISVGKK